MDYARKAIIELLEKYTQEELADILNEKQPNISAFKNGSRSVSKKARVILNERFGYDRDKLFKNSNDDFLSHLPDPEPKINPTKEDALNQLNYIKKKKDITTNKTPAIFHQITAYVLPVVGRLGLGIEMYSDAYFENELTKVTIPIKNKENNVKRYILAEFKGESMTNPELPEENIRDGAFVLLAEREKGSAWTEFIKKGKIMGFYDNDKNFTIKKVKSFRPNIGELCLEAINPDKTKDDNKDRCVELKNLWALYDYLGEQTF